MLISMLYVHLRVCSVRGQSDYMSAHYCDCRDLHQGNQFHRDAVRETLHEGRQKVMERPELIQFLAAE